MEVNGADLNGDGIVTIQVTAGGGIWVLNGIDLVEGTKAMLPALPQAASFGQVSIGAPTITDAQLAPIVAEAIRRWEATGLTADQRAALHAATFQIGDLLATGRLGEAAGGAIAIDDDANGLGWFVDPTSSRDEEFNGGTARRGEAAKEVDLLTVVAHELGHVLGGLSLDNAVVGNDIMAAELGAGMRRTPTATSLRSVAGDFFAPVVVNAVPVNATPTAKKAPAKLLPPTADDALFGPWVG